MLFAARTSKTIMNFLDDSEGVDNLTVNGNVVSEGSMIRGGLRVCGALKH
jgi:hypothetical protein